MTKESEAAHFRNLAVVLEHCRVRLKSEIGEVLLHDAQSGHSI